MFQACVNFQSSPIAVRHHLVIDITTDVADFVGTCQSAAWTLARFDEETTQMRRQQTTHWQHIVPLATSPSERNAVSISEADRPALAVGQ